MFVCMNFSSVCIIISWLYNIIMHRVHCFYPRACIACKCMTVAFVFTYLSAHALVTNFLHVFGCRFILYSFILRFVSWFRTNQATKGDLGKTQIKTRVLSWQKIHESTKALCLCRVAITNNEQSRFIMRQRRYL